MAVSEHFELTKETDRDEIRSWLTSVMKGKLLIYRRNGEIFLHLIFPHSVLFVHYKGEGGKSLGSGMVFLPDNYEITEEVIDTLEKIKKEGRWSVEVECMELRFKVGASPETAMEALKSIFPPPSGETTINLLISLIRLLSLEIDKTGPGTFSHFQSLLRFKLSEGGIINSFPLLYRYYGT